MRWLRKLLRLEKLPPPRVALADDVIKFSADGSEPLQMTIGDLAAVVEAMGSTALNAFLCWEADGAARPDSNLLAFAKLGQSKCVGRA